ncbi:hypothetical protein [Halobacteriaceae bacterium SHR40]|uniref:hypothetical protein n=1 Tax=Halovenus amylolytica TaxID=2500550 RepID=UPI000FE2AE22
MGVSPVDATRHDLSLFGIAVVLLIGLLVAQFSAVGLVSSLFVSSLPAAACVGYVLFYRPPAQPTG